MEVEGEKNSVGLRGNEGQRNRGKLKKVDIARESEGQGERADEMDEVEKGREGKGNRRPWKSETVTRE